MLTFLASFLLGLGRRISYSPSHARLIKHEEEGNSMFDLKRKLVAVAIGCFACAGAFAQKHDERPPKPPNTVVVAPKGEKPPPSNNNQGQKKPEDKKGKN
jgi:hypothetical protein